MAQPIIHIFLFLIGIGIVIGQTCTGFATVWDDCGSPCKDYCTADPDEICFGCVEGCYCIDGYKFKGVDAEDCVPVEQCPFCNSNEEYRICGTACPDYCNNPNGTICLEYCVEGCFCKEGYIRASNNSSAPCVQPIDCYM